jgi:hypothetical protein
VQIATNDIDKTTFCTQEGLFELFMMSFGLTNVSVTFQAMMNNILRPFLKRFVLVFFDDILIFSSSWVEHLWHVHLVLSKLQEHCLFIKKSKCAFGTSSVAYLSHTILAKGVTMDEDKIRTVLESWFHAGQGGGCLPQLRWLLSPLHQGVRCYSRAPHQAPTKRRFHVVVGGGAHVHHPATRLDASSGATVVGVRRCLHRGM